MDEDARRSTEPRRLLLLAANRNLVRLASRRLMLVDHDVNQSGVVLAYFVHIDVIRRAGDRERAGEQKCRQAYNSDYYFY
jgi:hypothetical protein